MDGKNKKIKFCVRFETKKPLLSSNFQYQRRKDAFKIYETFLGLTVATSESHSKRAA